MKSFLRDVRHCRPLNLGHRALKGFTVIELLVVLAIGTVLTVMSIPVIGNALSRMRLNSAVSSVTTTISKTHYRAIRNSDIYTMTITTPQNTFLVTDISQNKADRVEPLPSEVSINGGAAAAYTYTFCPNGTVYGAGAACVNNPNLPPALLVTYQARQTNINISTVGNVTTKIIR
jgi:prepilin-type N-terminal cleavage/methylation domain-containing protein